MRVTHNYDIGAVCKDLLCLFAIPSPLQHIAARNKMAWDAKLVNNLKRGPERSSDLTGAAASAVARWAVEGKQILPCRCTSASLRLAAYRLK